MKEHEENSSYIKVDVEENNEIAMEYGVSTILYLLPIIL